MQPVSIGPLVFAGDRLAAIIGIFISATAILASRLDPRLGRWSTWTLVAGVVGARIGHVVENGAGFAAEPWRMLAVWQGGFAWPWGAAVIAIVFAVLARSRRTAIGAVASLVIGLFAWNVVWQLTNATPATPAPDVALERTGETRQPSRPSTGSPWS